MRNTRITAKTKRVFVTTEGMEHETKQAANRHQADIDLRAWAEERQLDWAVNIDRFLDALKADAAKVTGLLNAYRWGNR